MPAGDIDASTSRCEFGHTDGSVCHAGLVVDHSRVYVGGFGNPTPILPGSQLKLRPPCVRVFSHAGVPLHRIDGPQWGRVEHLCFVDDRLYLTEEDGKRILVMEPGGRLLQTFSPAAWARPVGQQVQMEGGLVASGQR